MAINVLSLFDGISCGRIALERAGIEVENYYASEIDKYAIRISKANYPDIIQIGDVTKIDTLTLPKIDLLIGGSPCQGFSFAGRQLNFNDPRSKLFFEFVRIKNECNPNWFLLENVVMKKEYQNVISECLGVQPILINSALVSAQNRKRLYWTNIPYHSNPLDLGILFKDILDTNVESYRYLHPKTVTRSIVNKRARVIKNYNEKLPTILSSQKKQSTDSIVVLLPDGRRRWLSPLECERAQCVPDRYTDCVAFSHRNGALGNGWNVNTITHIFKNIPTSSYPCAQQP